MHVITCTGVATQSDHAFPLSAGDAACILVSQTSYPNVIEDSTYEGEFYTLNKNAYWVAATGSECFTKRSWSVRRRFNSIWCYPVSLATGIHSSMIERWKENVQIRRISLTTALFDMVLQPIFEDRFLLLPWLVASTPHLQTPARHQLSSTVSAASMKGVRTDNSVQLMNVKSTPQHEFTHGFCFLYLLQPAVSGQTV
jgi:hypothetical protein